MVRKSSPEKKIGFKKTKKPELESTEANVSPVVKADSKEEAEKISPIAPKSEPESRVQQVNGFDQKHDAPKPTSHPVNTGGNPVNSAPKNELRFLISEALMSKLKAQAIEEGISLQDYLRELLAEGATLRAWEIVERRIQMRGGQSSGNSQHQHNNRNHNSNHGGGNNQNRRGGGDRNQNRRGMSQSRYQNIMDDKASFLEYVRSTERQQR